MTAKLGILAGGGTLPAQLVEVCRQDGRDVFVLAFEGHTDPATVTGVEHVWTRLGAAGGAIQALRRAGVDELVMAGPISRPSVAELKPDLRSARFFAKAGAHAFGDDGLLSAVISALEDEGFRVVGIGDLLGHLIAEARPYGSLQPDDTARADIERGVAVAKALGAQDVGQSAVVQQGLVLGVEAVEGTDALLERCAQLRRAGPGGVLVKVKKPGQEKRADLPTIGPRTVEKAAAAGLRGIAVEAGGTLVIDGAGLAKAADGAELFIVGIPIDQ